VRSAEASAAAVEHAECPICFEELHAHACGVFTDARGKVSSVSRRCTALSILTQFASKPSVFHSISIITMLQAGGCGKIPHVL
jgi:hypothetical protein